MKRSFLWILLVAFDMICLDETVFSAGGAGYDARGKRDPFVALVTLAAKTSSGLMNVESLQDLAIEGIVYDAKHGSMVVVNGTVMKDGETNGPVKVVKIKSDGAIFSINGIDGFKPTYEEKPSNKKETE